MKEKQKTSKNPVFLCLLLFIYFHPTESLAIRSASRWVKKLGKSNQQSVATGTHPKKVILLSTLQPAEKLGANPIKHKSFLKTGYLKIEPHKNLSWSYLLNNYDKVEETAMDPFEYTFEVVSQLSSIDTVIYTDKVNWSLIFRDQQGIVQRVASKPPPKKASAKKIYSWLFANLGFNGVVLDSEQGHLLVGSANHFVKKGSQAVIYDQSVTPSIINKSNLKGLGLAECISRKNGFAVFKVLLQRDKITPGHKLYIYK